jgi:hypothetical protein
MLSYGRPCFTFPMGADPVGPLLETLVHQPAIVAAKGRIDIAISRGATFGVGCAEFDGLAGVAIHRCVVVGNFLRG